LKKSEKERKDDLSFLFQTEEQEEKLRRIERIFNKLKSGKEALENEILNFEIIEEKERPLFEKIFNDVEIDFDKPSLFDGLDHASADVKKTQYFEKLDKIKDFVDRFSPEVYEKKRKKKEFEAAILLFCTLN
jgi:exonuclease SbcC